MKKDEIPFGDKCIYGIIFGMFAGALIGAILGFIHNYHLK
jgi:hypothetical protein